MRYRFLILLLMLPLLISPVAAQASPVDDEFTAGARAFREQDYRQALYHFSRAEKAGMRAARLDYNFGVVFYRLQQYAQSRRYFEKLLDHPKFGALALSPAATKLSRSTRGRKAVTSCSLQLPLMTTPKSPASVVQLSPQVPDTRG